MQENENITKDNLDNKHIHSKLFNHKTLSILAVLFVAMLVYFFVGDNKEIINNYNKDTSIKVRAPDPLSILDDITIIPQEDAVLVMLDLSQHAKFRVTRSTDLTTYTVTLYNTKQAQITPAIITNKVISNIAIEEMSNNIRVTFTLDPKAVVNEISYANEQSNKLIVKLSITDNNREFNMTKVKTVKSSLELSDNYYQEALDLANLGNIYGAYQKAQMALDYNIENHDARKMYILSALNLGKKTVAINALDRGLLISPGMLSYIKIKAELLVSEDRTLEALELLLTQSPPVEIEDEYYAFIAAIQQKLGNHEQAIKLYLDLVKISPNNGEYWAGLGVSFDSQGDERQAYAAFVKAQKIGGLDLNLQNYVAERIRVLD